MQNAETPVVESLPRILVVDDTPENLHLMSGLLEDRCQLLLASSGHDALRIAMSRTPPDLILLDIMMPDMDGYEVLRRLRQHPPTAEIPVVFLTALSSPKDEVLGRGLGAEDYITKPIDPRAVLARLNHLVEHSAGMRRWRAMTEKLARHLTPDAYRALFAPAPGGQMVVEQKMLTLFHSDLGGLMLAGGVDVADHTAGWRRNFVEEMRAIAVEHGGTVDPFSDQAMVVYFGDLNSTGVRHDAIHCVRMAQAMQRRANELRTLHDAPAEHAVSAMRIGISTGFCDVGRFELDGEQVCTLAGAEIEVAHRLEQQAHAGEIVLASATRNWVCADVVLDACERTKPVAGVPVVIGGYLVHDSEHEPEWKPPVASSYVPLGRY